MATFENVRTNQLSAEGTAWFQEVLRVIETMDADAYVEMMSDDVELVLNNGEVTLAGREAVRDGLAPAWQQLAGLAHDELNIYGTDYHFVHEAVNVFTLPDGNSITGRSTVWIDRDEQGRLAAARVYGNPQG